MGVKLLLICFLFLFPFLYHTILQFGLCSNLNLFCLQSYVINWLCLTTSIFLQIPEALFQTTLKLLVDVVNSETATLASVAVQALGHIGLIVALPSLIIESSSGNSIVFLSYHILSLPLDRDLYNSLIELQLIFWCFYKKDWESYLRVMILKQFRKLSYLLVTSV